jgi:serine/threonine protein kinase
MRLLENARAANAEGFFEPAPPATASPSMTEIDQGRGQGSAEPTCVGKYQIVRPFSEVGGQATAYLAFDPDLERHVVLKRYHGGPRGTPGEAEEGRALSRVHSPYVARCHGIEWIDSEAFLVVEYIPGRNLTDVQRDGPLDVTQVVRVVSQLAEGVAAVHACGLIHRDIKPANVILHDDGAPRLVDFGLAAHLGSSRLHELSGSPRYMAPEQARGEWDRVDHRTDVFGLGALLYKLLTDRPPHTGSTCSEILAHAKKADITPPRQLNSTIPASLEAVCLKALAAAPENRYTTALEFATALQQATEPTPVAAPTPSGRLLWGRRRLPAAVFACGLLALAGWFWPRGRETVSRVDPPLVSGPLEAEIAVRHFKDRGDGRSVEPRGTISETSLSNDPPRLNDLLRIHVTLSHSAYGYLIALNPDGTDQLCLPAGGIAPSSPRRELDFPENPADYFGLTDGVGLQAFVVVASERPLPAYESWKTRIPGGLGWSSVDREGLWTCNSATLAEASRLRGRLRGQVLHREAAPETLVNLCDRLRRAPGVSLVHAVAFPVKADQEIMK